MDTEPCPACGHQVIWAHDQSARRIPVDREPSPEGTLSLSPGWDGTPRARVPSAKLAFGRTNLHSPHLKTCLRPARLKQLAWL